MTGPIPVVELDETASTNAEAMARAIATGPSGYAMPFWVLATRQTAGRGRSGRGWVSLPGNLHASLAMTVTAAPAEAACLSLVAGVAVARMLRSHARAEPNAICLKWPNDILVGRAKAGGILIETTRQNPAHPASSASLTAIVGIGLNLSHAPALDGSPTATVADAGVVLSPRQAVDALSDQFIDLLTLWQSPDGLSQIIPLWQSLATRVGEPMSVHAGTAPVHGNYAGLDSDGALLLDTGGPIPRRFTFGDVTLG
ncbi:MAG: biotin--[acetyl-CoA-carboxylase] ligase [Hyphomicrobiaceae bacterium]|nr:biotin--[acetyl-CoA-carboxylase] ligase [Hyphomicrobiaceae bacterium]